MRCWIDTDVGGDPDDAVTLRCAVGHPDVELVGVSTVDGDVEHRAEVARMILPDDVSVVAGPPPGEAVRSADALLAIGPWTHVAKLARAGSLPPRVACMGGTLQPVMHRGELNAVEHNVGRDPLAARQLLEITPDLLIVTLDVTARLLCTPEEELDLVHAFQPLGPMVSAWRSQGSPLCLHDPLALLALCGEPVVRVERRRLRVDDEGHVLEDAAGTEHTVVVDADRDAVVARVVALVGAAHLG